MIRLLNAKYSTIAVSFHDEQEALMKQIMKNVHCYINCAKRVSSYALSVVYISSSNCIYRIAGMFHRVKVSF